MAETLAREKKALFAALNERVTQARTNEDAKREELKTRYAQHLKEADAGAETLYQDRSERKAAYYQQLLQVAKTSHDIEELEWASRRFETLGNYQDSKNLAEHCRARANEERVIMRLADEKRLEEERLAEEKRLEEERLAAEKRAVKRKKIGILSGTAAAVVIAAVLLVTQVIIPSGKYNKAVALMEEGNTAQAAIMFGSAGNYKDAAEKSMALWDEITARDGTIVAGSWNTVGLKADGSTTNQPHFTDRQNVSGCKRDFHKSPEN